MSNQGHLSNCIKFPLTLLCPFCVQQLNELFADKAELEAHKQLLIDFSRTQAEEHELAMQQQLQHQLEETTAVGFWERDYFIYRSAI